jgi:hypothetical protein
MGRRVGTQNNDEAIVGVLNAILVEVKENNALMTQKNIDTMRIAERVRKVGINFNDLK